MIDVPTNDKPPGPPITTTVGGTVAHFGFDKELLSFGREIEISTEFINRSSVVSLLM
jgi:hypothetical protein